MSDHKVSSDLHLGHASMMRWRTGFSCIEHHDEIVLNNHHATIGKNDIWTCLGDVAFTKDALLRLKEINCRKKILILGNHCTERGIKISDYFEVFDEVHAYKTKKIDGVKFLFSHMPVLTEELRECHNVHGHTHMAIMNSDQHTNVCVEHTNWGAVSLVALANKLKGKMK